MRGEGDKGAQRYRRRAPLLYNDEWRFPQRPPRSPGRTLGPGTHGRFLFSFVTCLFGCSKGEYYHPMAAVGCRCAGLTCRSRPGAKPQGEVECALVIQMACTHTAAMSVLGTFAVARTCEMPLTSVYSEPLTARLATCRPFGVGHPLGSAVS